MKRKLAENRTVVLGRCQIASSVNLRCVASTIASSKLASWALVLSLLLQLVSGERDALVRVQPGGAVVRGVYSRSGPEGFNASGIIRSVTNVCSEADGGSSGQQNADVGMKEIEDGYEMDDDDDSREEEEEWVGYFYLPPLEETAGAQGGTGCSLLEQVKQAMLFGASALLVLALNPGLFKEIELHFTSDMPIVLITDPKEIKKLQSNLDSRKNKQHVNITAKPESTAKTKSHTTPRLTLWSTCGRSIGGSRFREWEGTVCLNQHEGSVEHGFWPIWRSLLSVIIGYYIFNMIRGITHQPQQSKIEDIEVTLQRLARQSMSKMAVWKYKRKRYQLPSDAQESCAVCLDEFLKGQTVRMLPCHHQFHNRCVDGWLIYKRTCPLCKLDIIDQRFGLGKTC